MRRSGSAWASVARSGRGCGRGGRLGRGLECWEEEEEEGEGGWKGRGGEHKLMTFFFFSLEILLSHVYADEGDSLVYGWSGLAALLSCSFVSF